MSIQESIKVLPLDIDIKVLLKNGKEISGTVGQPEYENTMVIHSCGSMYEIDVAEVSAIAYKDPRQTN